MESKNTSAPVAKTFTAKDVPPYFREDPAVFRCFLATFLPIPGFPDPPPGSDEVVSCLVVIESHTPLGEFDQNIIPIDLPQGFIAHLGSSSDFQRVLGTVAIMQWQATEIPRKVCWVCHKPWNGPEFGSMLSITTMGNPTEREMPGLSGIISAVFNFFFYSYCDNSPTCQHAAKVTFLRYMKGLGHNQFNPDTMMENKALRHGCTYCCKLESSAGAFLQCGRCLGIGIVYCSKECQAADWDRHKLLCKKPEGKGKARKSSKKGRKKNGTILRNK